MTRALRAVLIAVLCIAPIFPANAARGDFAIPIVTRDRIVTCAAANFAVGMTALNKSDQDDRIKRSATFTLVIVEAEDADPKSLQGKMMSQVAPFVELLRRDRQRAWSIIKDCDAILRVGELYSGLAARGAP